MRNLKGQLTLENQVPEVRGHYTALGRITTAPSRSSVRQLEVNWLSQPIPEEPKRPRTNIWHGRALWCSL